ncbi:AAA family ATPase [Clostridium sp. D2Q-14]|uniref:ATP-binding protein n=1 Tax=Anaeromonas gelatinilytica TaxID=2683194 RepID=UPI00193B0008|nr:AAA family ATPase [Anaeromonas gelatinilytica]MBS4535323.1 AAA family ATPase [Anaeromonas gelatinilytica]
MINKIHILGASGSGTTTLAQVLSNKLSYMHFDTDNYFWKPTNPPFQEKRDKEERKTLLNSHLKRHNDWILSGSLCGWGDVFIPYFDLVIYLWLPKELRMNRLKDREKQRYGELIEIDGIMHKQHKEFINWAAQYDDGDLTIRSKELHEKWITELPCKVLRLEGVFELEEKVESVLEFIEAEKI